jgi:uncharacterized repeat protein (TIGR01451 family)
MKRFTALLTAALAVLLLLSGCATETSTKNPTTTPATEPIPTTEPIPIQKSTPATQPAQTLTPTQTDIAGAVVSELNADQPVWLIAGVRLKGDIGNFVKKVNAEPGDTIEVNISVRNMSNDELTLAIAAVLPDGLSLIEDSAQLYDSLNDGSQLGDITKWTSLNRYSVYSVSDESTKGYATVTYDVFVSDDFSNPRAGVQTLNICNEAGGYKDGKVATDTYVYYTAVIVDYGTKAT